MEIWQIVLIVGGIPLGLGIVFLAIGLLRRRMMRGWVRTTGVVVDKRTGRADGGVRAIYPTFQWQDDSGRVHQRTSIVRQSLAPAPGKRVTLRYDPTEPSRAAIDSFVQNGSIFAVIGSVLVVVGLLVATMISVFGSMSWS
ncbi:DUF3592 domain-containing protein [Aeromicrobium sp.]|uniref:DUF3592 domain-containing protein n=1 Tax=Aeromicrobium sp. TaxID=1871063 RepID=UPI003D6B9C7D